jgi:hypothetical protein
MKYEKEIPLTPLTQARTLREMPCAGMVRDRHISLWRLFAKLDLVLNSITKGLNNGHHCG